MTPPEQSTSNPYTRTANELLTLLGGAENIITVTHCVTRLRITLADHQTVDNTGLRDHPAVLGRIENDETFHLLVGPATATPLAHACTELLTNHDDNVHSERNIPLNDSHEEEPPKPSPHSHGPQPEPRDPKTWIYRSSPDRST
ncbi:PTS system, glucose-like IIB component [Actinopolyspora xinjiangensis]|uniref:PTS system, glucose-like IIB component n=1 Tax=Actinopolyspora xinjiangensis TaxID=405564 RepID=A0A1H0X143_9ACTN|nr:PTS glucose/sucrose transporter subunit IIB [Actinopolyspora xinjiangensis]SDP96455.1 PTS system, glucose-like IIB component [Actinopolyspora xinjiangensis]